MNKLFISLTALSLPLAVNAALYDRGNGMIYDDVLNITWLQDANYARTSSYDADGLMTWSEANAWADQLVYGGYDDWRLPSANLMNPNSPCFSYDGSCDWGYNNTTSELGHIFYTDLENLGAFDTSGNRPYPGYFVVNTSFIDGDSGDTISILNYRSMYWLGEEYAGYGWAFHAAYGRQNYNNKNDIYSAWAVRDGDISAVPVPAAFWLFGSALLGLFGFKRHNR